MKILLLLPIIFLACTNNSSTTENNTSHRDTAVTVSEDKPTQKPTGDSPVREGNCYWQVMQRDTFVASFSRTGPEVTGKLSFDNYQKDGSSGTVTGTISGDIMKLWYSFQSEGMQSVMEVWFKKDGDKLLRGTGEMAVKADTSYFSNPASINYNSGQVLQRISCAEVPSKYK